MVGLVLVRLSSGAQTADFLYPHMVEREVGGGMGQERETQVPKGLQDEKNCEPGEQRENRERSEQDSGP